MVAIAAASKAFADWNERPVKRPPSRDCAPNVLEPNEQWRAYLQAMSGFISGAPLEQISVADYVAYDTTTRAITGDSEPGYGALISSRLPPRMELRLSMPLEGIELRVGSGEIDPAHGKLRARSAILTPSTAVLASEAIALPAASEPWKQATTCLPVGRDEKLYMEIVGENSPFASETHVLRDPETSRRAFSSSVHWASLSSSAFPVMGAPGTYPTKARWSALRGLVHIITNGSPMSASRSFIHGYNTKFEDLFHSP